MAGNTKSPAGGRPHGKKGASKGTGGKGRRALAGKGPTPKAEDREYHVAAKRRRAVERVAVHSESAERRAEARRSAGGKAGTVGAENEIVAGRNPVLEAVRAGIQVRKVYMFASVVGDAKLMEVVQAATAFGAPVVEVTRSELDRITDGAVHQGVAIQVPAFTYSEPAELLAGAAAVGESALLVALDGITDPQNLGAILRSAAAFGAHGVILPARRSAAVNVTAWKVSAGAAAHIKVARETNLVRTLEDLRAAGCFIVGLDGGGDAEISAVPVADQPLVIVTGAEGKGLSALVRKKCDVVASIPISAAVESLNAAVATSVALYAIQQQRRG